ncbi:MAG: hypothetical protein AABZ53_11985 [Planctomycetota bacterium]
MSNLVHFLGETDIRGIMGIGIPYAGIGLGCVAIIAGTIRQISTARAREMTKRELGAYVAEGTMRPEDAEKILNADRPQKGC